MKKRFYLPTMFCVLLMAGLVLPALANNAVDADEPAIMASPQTVVLAKVAAMTIHSNITASLVDLSMVQVNGITPAGCGVDSLGHLVIKVAIKDLNLLPRTADVLVTGIFFSGEPFAASDTVTVK